jgi:hypothetical protein
MSKMPVNRRKIVIAAVLLSVMAMMWLRVFLKSGPEQASAAINVGAAGSQVAANQPAQARLSYIKLNVTTGRNDRLTRDIFTAQNPAVFGWGDDSTRRQSNIVTDPDSNRAMNAETIRRIAKVLTVDAILVGSRGNSSEAFVKDKLVTTGSKLAVKNEDKIYTFTVTEIQHNKVIFECQNVTIAVKMVQPMQAE